MRRRKQSTLSLCDRLFLFFFLVPFSKYDIAMRASCVLAAATALFMASTEAFVPVTPGESLTWLVCGRRFSFACSSATPRENALERQQCRAQGASFVRLVTVVAVVGDLGVNVFALRLHVMTSWCSSGSCRERGLQCGNPEDGSGGVGCRGGDGSGRRGRGDSRCPPWSRRWTVPLLLSLSWGFSDSSPEGAGSNSARSFLMLSRYR